jgi:hypothetical protein
MRKLTDVPAPDGVLDEFVGALLGAGAVLSQIITQMVQYAAAGGPVPDAVPIPIAAHELLVDTLSELEHRHARRDLKTAAALLKDATDRICDEVFFIPREEVERLKLGTDDAAHGKGGGVDGRR